MRKRITTKRKNLNNEKRNTRKEKSTKQRDINLSLRKKKSFLGPGL